MPKPTAITWAALTISFAVAGFARKDPTWHYAAGFGAAVTVLAIWQ